MSSAGNAQAGYLAPAEAMNATVSGGGTAATNKVGHLRTETPHHSFLHMRLEIAAERV